MAFMLIARFVHTIKGSRVGRTVWYQRSSPFLAPSRESLGKRSSRSMTTARAGTTGVPYPADRPRSVLGAAPAGTFGPTVVPAWSFLLFTFFSPSFQHIDGPYNICGGAPWLCSGSGWRSASFQPTRPRSRTISWKMRISTSWMPIPGSPAPSVRWGWERCF